MTTPVRQLLALGKFQHDERAAIAAAAGQAAFTADFVDAGREATKWLDSHAPHAVVLEDSEAARSLCLEARAQSQHAQVPMLARSAEVDDLSFAEVFSWGGDDAVVAGDNQGLLGRLRALPAALPGAPTNGRGPALIVDADRTRRILMGRVLRNAGHSIEFAVSYDDALGRVREREPKVVVSASDIGETPAALLKAARETGSKATWIVTCPPKDMHGVRVAVEPFGGATATDGFAPAENIVFLANELARGGANDKRASRRLLFGTTVSFRGAGRDRDERGFSYNVSVGGLYVRTLAPPEDDWVWLELRPPRCERLVRLEGRIVWRRKFGSPEGATVPPGFGVAIADASQRDMEAWRRGYAAFADALGYTDAMTSHPPAG
jgi:DNA-binding response OmpR family regulator